ncbi:MAG: IS630 transposase-related protein [Holosporales bacterium]
MSYSIDLRERAVKYVREGGSQTSASKLFKVGRRTLYDWLQRESLEPKKPSGRKRKLSKEALAAADVRERPDTLLRRKPFSVPSSSPENYKINNKNLLSFSMP